MSRAPRYYTAGSYPMCGTPLRPFVFQVNSFDVFFSPLLFYLLAAETRAAFAREYIQVQIRAPYYYSERLASLASLGSLQSREAAILPW